MRLFLLRMLIGIWFIPLMTILGFPMAYLIYGYDEAKNAVKGIAHDFWFGMD